MEYVVYYLDKPIAQFFEAEDALSYVFQKDGGCQLSAYTIKKILKIDMDVLKEFKK